MAGRLGDILVGRGVITNAQLDSALALQGTERDMLGTILLRRGLVSVEQLGSALEEQFEVPFRMIVPEAVNGQVVRLIPEDLARTACAVPVSIVRGTLTLAMAAPDDIETISEVELITGYQIEPQVALEADIQATLDRGFDDRIVARQTVVDMRLAELGKADRAPTDEHGTDEQEEAEAPVVRLVGSILRGAIESGTSDVHLEPFHPEMRVRYRIDGELQQVMTIPENIREAVISRIKVMADMDTTESRRPQDGHLLVVDGTTRANLRASTIPTVGGEKVVLRVLDEGSRLFSLDQLGLNGRDRGLVQKLIDKQYGMFVVTGPTGSGKTTTMYAALSAMNAVTRNIVTVEDPVEYRLSGVNQVSSDNEHGLGFANALRHIMRQDPDVIMVGEIRDHETAVTAVQAALTGHLLISTLHTNNAVGVVARLNDLGIDPFKIGGGLLGSVAQLLLRAICVECKVPTEPNRVLMDAFSARQSVPDDAVFFQGRGCRKCLGTGYAGRTAIFEVMMVTTRLVEAIEQNLPTTKLREIALEEGMVELATAGLKNALAGRTTIEEVLLKLSS